MEADLDHGRNSVHVRWPGNQGLPRPRAGRGGHPAPEQRICPFSAFCCERALQRGAHGAHTLPSGTFTLNLLIDRLVSARSVLADAPRKMLHRPGVPRSPQVHP